MGWVFDNAKDCWHFPGIGWTGYATPRRAPRLGPRTRSSKCRDIVIEFTGALPGVIVDRFVFEWDSDEDCSGMLPVYRKWIRSVVCNSIITYECARVYGDGEPYEFLDLGRLAAGTRTGRMITNKTRSKSARRVNIQQQTLYEMLVGKTILPAKAAHSVLGEIWEFKSNAEREKGLSTFKASQTKEGIKIGFDMDGQAEQLFLELGEIRFCVTRVKYSESWRPEGASEVFGLQNKALMDAAGNITDVVPHEKETLNYLLFRGKNNIDTFMFMLREMITEGVGSKLLTVENAAFDAYHDDLEKRRKIVEDRIGAVGG